MPPVPPPRPWFVDALGQWLGLAHERPGVLRLTVRPELLDAGGLLAGPVGFALIDYAMGSALWDVLAEGEGMATQNVAINFLATARAGELVCTARIDRRHRTAAALSAELRTAPGDGSEPRLLCTAIGSYVIVAGMPLHPPPGLLPAYEGTPPS